MLRKKRIPTATYRLQLNRSFTFADAAKIADYLYRLGISDCYVSPIFQAGPESTHGYDVCGFGRVNACLGGRESLEIWASELRQRGMGLLLDMVPNHMGNDLSNAWWLDVLAKGKRSRYASWFDIDWDPAHLGYRDQVLLPILEDRYGPVLEAGKLKIVRHGKTFALAHYDLKLPLNRAGVQAILQPLGTNRSSESIDQRIQRINGTPGDAKSFAELDAIIGRQHYRLAYWRIGPQEINYRRFFDVTELVAMRMESSDVFQESHSLVRELVRANVVTGMRVDHPDGLWNPKQYFDRLQESGPLYVVAEKILSGDEPLPEDWAVDGTTGYDFLNMLNGLFVDNSTRAEFDRIYREFAGVDSRHFRELVYDCKRLVLDRSFPRETTALTHQLKALSQSIRAGRDLTFPELHNAICDVVVAFPVYRTYLTESTETISGADRQAIHDACRGAVGLRPGNRAAIHFLCSLLRLECDATDRSRDAARDFIMRFQQLTAPVKAKGLEDTAFYRFARFLSLNEVGGEPGRFGLECSDFHKYNLRKQKRWPNSLLATATHDTKRGEDLRARLNVLSEIPTLWQNTVTSWAALNAAAKAFAGTIEAPDRNDEYLIYQTILGALVPGETEHSPGFTDRIVQCTLKSIRESKRHTTWTEPGKDYENATEQFVRYILRVGVDNQFVRQLRGFAGPVAYHGFINSIAQTVLKCGSPGVPDIYQGAELWDLNLVDPDNRRPVNYAQRQKILAEFEQGFASHDPALIESLLEGWPSGRVKLFTLWRLLHLRRERRTLFETGSYIPIEVSGLKARHLCAFGRAASSARGVFIAPRFSWTLSSGEERPPIGSTTWQDTQIHIPKTLEGVFEDIFTGQKTTLSGKVNIAEVLSRFPVACAFEGSSQRNGK